MAENIANILDAACRLPLSDRAELVYNVLLSFEPTDGDSQADCQRAWEIELDRRADEIRAGTAPGEPADQVFARWQARRQ